MEGYLRVRGRGSCDFPVPSRSRSPQTLEPIFDLEVLATRTKLFFIEHQNRDEVLGILEPTTNMCSVVNQCLSGVEQAVDMVDRTFIGQVQSAKFRRTA